MVIFVFLSHSGKLIYYLLSAGSFDVWNDQASFQMLTIGDLLFFLWLVAEQELADLERWKQQNRAKPVHLVPQRLGE